MSDSTESKTELAPLNTSSITNINVSSPAIAVTVTPQAAAPAAEPAADGAAVAAAPVAAPALTFDEATVSALLTTLFAGQADKIAAIPQSVSLVKAVVDLPTINTFADSIKEILQMEQAAAGATGATATIDAVAMTVPITKIMRGLQTYLTGLKSGILSAAQKKFITDNLLLVTETTILVVCEVVGITDAIRTAEIQNILVMVNEIDSIAIVFGADKCCKCCIIQ